MFIDGRTLEDGHSIQCDVCIIGAGAAGIALAMELRNTSLDVCLVESGGLDKDRNAEALNRGESVGYPYWSLADVRHRQFGGTANLWRLPLGIDGQLGLKLRPLDAIDFEKREWLAESGWPISRNDLDPYYERAQQYFGLGPPKYDGGQWADAAGSPQLPVDEDIVRTVVFQYGARDVFTQRHRDTLKTARNVTTVLNSTAVEIVTNEEASAASYVRLQTGDGRECRVSARSVVLAAGGIENPRLLLLSNSRQSEGLGNDHDVVGRYFMEHPHFVSGTFVPSDKSIFSRSRLYDKHRVGDDVVMASLSLAERVTRGEELLNFCATLGATTRMRHDVHLSRGFASLREVRSFLKHAHPPRTVGKHLVNIFGDLPVLAAHGGMKVTDALRGKLGLGRDPIAFDLYHMSEQVPNRSSRVMLSDATDAFGCQQARLDWRLTSDDIALVVKGQRVMDAELRRAGLGYIEPEEYNELPPPGIRGGYHHMGTTRMSTDPKRGVVDGSCRVHGISNVYVAGSSVFATSGFANPTLTLVALAIRLADNLKAVLSGPRAPTS